MLSVVLLALVGLKPIPSNLPLVDRLANHPELWEVQVSESNAKKLRAVAPKVKSSLLILLNDNRFSALDLKLVALFAVSSFFSFVGWRRETCLQGKVADEAEQHRE